VGIQEKRRFSRIPFDSPIRLLGRHGEWESRLLDICLKGALVEKPPGWVGEIGEPFALTITLDRNVSVIHMEARLTHMHDDVMGFYCDNIDVESMSHLKRLVQLNLGNEELVNRELSALMETWTHPART
jgi:hypothetical protein